MAKVFMTGSEGLKSIDLPQYPDAAWDWISGAPQGNTALYDTVAFVYRAVQLTAGAVTQIPFAIVNEATGEDIEVSTEWKNKLGFMPNPNKLIQLLEMSLILYGKGYIFKERNRVRTLGLKYISPLSITENFDSTNGLIGFRRSLGTMTQDLEPADLLYFWEPDPRVEIGPPLAWRMTAMMDAAGLLKWYDYFVSEFAKRGGVLPTMLMVKGMPVVQERERLETYWDKFVKGFYRVAGKVFNGESMSVATVGEGPGSLGDISLTEDKRTDIAVAAGIPLSLLMSNAANYATANADRKNWIQQTVMPDCNFIAGVFNAQLYNPLGLRMEYRPETLNEFQEEETQRAGAFAQYVQAGMIPSIAAQVVGIEPPPGVEYDDMFITEHPEPEQPAAAEPATPEISDEQDMEDAEDEVSGTPIMSAQAWKDLDTWKRLAMKAVKKGNLPTFTFTTTAIPDKVYQTIAGGLSTATNAETITQVFKQATEPGKAQQPPADDIKSLLEGIRMGVEALREANHE